MISLVFTEMGKIEKSRDEFFSNYQIN